MKKILAIDDNNINIELLAQIVKFYYPDYTFLSAYNGSEGIEKAQKENPDLILLDIRMPGLNGYETCEILKQDSNTKNIPIIMVSALGRETSERTKGLNAGADSFISKPFDQTELQAQINVALRIKKYQEQLKKLYSEITLIEEKERRRIAENLHDSLGQTLSLAFMNLSAIVDLEHTPAVQRTIDNISQLLDKAIKESRTLTYDLSPPILYELGFIPAVKWKLEQFENENGVNTELISNGIENIFKKEINIFLYRVVVELLNNVTKHAQANKVVVRTDIENQNFRLFVEDDGIGFQENKSQPDATGGFGLLSITERIESINGTFEIGSKDKKTIAEISVPINKNTKT